MASDAPSQAAASPGDSARGALLGLAAGEHRAGGGSATGMALVLARSIAATGTYEAGAAVRGYIDLLRADPDGMGSVTRSSLEKMAAGATPYDASRRTHEENGGRTAGNGPLTRAAPIGLAFARDARGLRDVVLSDAAATHYDALAGKTAMVLAQVVAWHLTGGPRLVWDYLRDPADYDDRLQDVIIRAFGGQRPQAVALAEGEPGYAPGTLALALTAYFDATSLEEGLEWALGAQGDRAGNGAATGALLGVRFGASAIPADWLDGVAAHDELDRAALAISGIPA